MRILTLYCLREELKLFGAAMFFFSGLLVLGRLMDLLRLVLNEGAPLLNILSIVALWMPSGISYAIPMSLLFAILIGYGQMAQQEELTAIRSAGVSPVELLSPAIYLGAALTLALFVNEAWVAPPARLTFQKKLTEITRDARIENLIQPGTMLTFGKIKFSCDGVEPGRVPVFKNIFFEYTGDPPYRIMAEKAWIDREGAAPEFQFGNGQILWTEAEKYLSVQFQSAAYALPPPQPSTGGARPKDLGILELWAMPGGAARFEYHKKMALVFAPFFFAWFAATLSMLIKRGNRVLGFMLTLGVLAGYYIILALAGASRSAAPDGALLMVWTPNLILLTLGYFFYRLIFVF
ncbi:LptF/LptG family permease [bacterium]|nr:LptF/LptG family permease [bacterium]